MELKRAKVIRLKTEKSPMRGDVLLRHLWKDNPKLECYSLWMYKDTETIGGVEQYTTLNGSFRDATSSFENTNLYITVGHEVEPLKVGDWYLSKTYLGSKDEFEGQKPAQLREEDIQMYKALKEIAYKIIATTDKKITREHDDTVGFPKMRNTKVAEPSKGFLEAYCKAGGIDEVLVEYEYTGGHEEIPVHMWNTLKVGKNNTITIRQEEKEFVYDDITHALAYGYKARMEGLSHHEALLNYKKERDQIHGVSKSNNLT